MPALRVLQIVLGLTGGLFCVGRAVSTIPSAEGLAIGFIAAAPFAVLVPVGAWLFRASRSRLADGLLLALTAACAAFSGLVYAVVRPTESGSSIVWFVLPFYQIVAVLLFVALWAIGRRLER